MTDRAAGWRALALAGADVERAVAFLHVHADVQGVLEEAADRRVVWLVGDVPPLPAGLAVQVQDRVVADADFAITGLEHDAEILVAPDLLVRPPWVGRPDGFAGIELVVPRGGAFGSGEHASTQAALLLLHRTWRAPQSLADVGCGSGILALYGQVRGVAHLEACDIDAASVAAAGELLPGARLVVGGPDALRACEAVVANMTGAELDACLPEILALWQGPAPLVLSGMRGAEVERIGGRIAAAAVDRETVGEFTAVAFARR
ncbi:MAG: 50S ribosomal protein L11 methyltransferase [Planctomycetes bacterium]|nr:50S ribosomal protein L11 methyltransferase [Planctomycetota bacterium]